MILVDTSVWIDWLIDDDDILLAPVVLQELLQGARGSEQLATLRTRFEALPMLMPTRNTFAEAGALYARCRWAGITPRSPHDCLIARTAIEHDVLLLHDDRDFELIANVERGLRLWRA